MKTGGFFKTNWAYIIWALIYMAILWAFLGGTILALFITIGVYAISITIALSPAGEYILRIMQGARKPMTAEEKDYLMPIFDDVYESAKKITPKLGDKIELHIMDVMYINAFALGRNTIAVTRGAIESFSPEELKGIFAHEFGHITNGDTKALLITTVGNGIFTIIMAIINFILRAIDGAFSASTNQAFALVVKIFTLLFGLYVFAFCQLGNIVIALNSRNSEFLADKYAQMIGYGEDLKNALYLLNKISMSGKISFIDRLKASHPHLARRIEKLEA